MSGNRSARALSQPFLAVETAASLAFMVRFSVSRIPNMSWMLSRWAFCAGAQSAEASAMVSNACFVFIIFRLFICIHPEFFYSK